MNRHSFIEKDHHSSPYQSGMKTEYDDVIMKNKNFMKLFSKEKLFEIVKKFERTTVNVLIVGGAGVGKSSTINVLFDAEKKAGRVKESEKAVVGHSIRPETSEIKLYKMEVMNIWDTPGLGDSPKKDKEYIKMIEDKLSEKDEQGKPLIDIVFLVIDTSSRDFASAYKLVEAVVPFLADERENMLLIGLNKVDTVKVGDDAECWDSEKNEPKEALKDYLQKQVEITKERIRESTGLNVDPVCYAVGDKNQGIMPYNLQEVIFHIMEKLPKRKRFVISIEQNENDENFASGKIYKETIETMANESFLGNFKNYCEKKVDSAVEYLKKILPQR